MAWIAACALKGLSYETNPEIEENRNFQSKIAVFDEIQVLYLVLARKFKQK